MGLSAPEHPATTSVNEISAAESKYLWNVVIEANLWQSCSTNGRKMDLLTFTVTF
ncbi:MAG: hypothetical protein NVS2B16_35460 [Chloroflexota bacterium]